MSCARCKLSSTGAAQAKKTRPELVLLTNEECQNIERAPLSESTRRKGRPSPALPPKPKRKRNRSNATNKTPSETQRQERQEIKKNSTPETPPKQSIASARSVARAWTQSVSESESDKPQDSETHESPTKQKPRFRIDSAHAPLQPQRDSQSAITDTDSINEMTRLDPHRDSITTARRAITFGLLIFMLGQIGVQWGFFASHFPAWSIGTLFSIGGIAIALLSVTECFKRVERQLRNSNRPTARPTRSRKSKSRSKPKTARRNSNEI